MAKKKETEDKISITQFKDRSSNWFVDMVHYHLNEVGDIIFCSGGLDTIERRDALKSYIKRNKKSFCKREPSIFELEEIEYTKLTFGKYKGESTMSIVATDKNYAK